MSIHQTEHLLRGAPLGAALPPPTERPHITHFVYDHHYDFKEFLANFPSAKLIGFGGLQGFRFHINVLGKANLRKAYFTGEMDTAAHYLMPSPSTKIGDTNSKNLFVFGYLVIVSQQDDIKIHQHYGFERIRAFQTIAARIVNGKLPIARVKVAFYFDPRNTMDGLVNLKEINKPEYARWETGLIALLRLRCPRWYIENVLKHLHGYFVDVEPFEISLKQIESKPASNKLDSERPYYSQRISKAIELRQTGNDALLLQKKEASQRAPGGRQILATGHPQRPKVAVSSDPLRTPMIESINRPDQRPPQAVSVTQQKRRFQEEAAISQLPMKKHKLLGSSQIHPGQSRPYQSTPAGTLMRERPPQSKEGMSKDVRFQQQNGRLQQRPHGVLPHMNSAVASGTSMMSGPQQQRRMPDVGLFKPPAAAHPQERRPQQSQNGVSPMNCVHYSEANGISSNQRLQLPSPGSGKYPDKNGWTPPSIMYQAIKGPQAHCSAIQNGNKNPGISTNAQQPDPADQRRVSSGEKNGFLANGQQPGPSHQRRASVSGGDMHSVPPNAAQYILKKHQQSVHVPVPRKEDSSRLVGGCTQEQTQKRKYSDVEGGAEFQYQLTSTSAVSVRRTIPPAPSSLRNEL